MRLLNFSAILVLSFAFLSCNGQQDNKKTNVVTINLPSESFRSLDILLLDSLKIRDNLKVSSLVRDYINECKANNVSNGELINCDITKINSNKIKVEKVYAPGGQVNSPIAKFNRENFDNYSWFINRDDKSIRISFDYLFDISSMQLGDPEKLVAALINLSNEQNPLVHLLMRPDAYQIVMQKRASEQEEFETWKGLTLSTDLDDKADSPKFS